MTLRAGHPPVDGEHGDTHDRGTADPDAGKDLARIQQAKHALRERIWALLDEHGAVHPPGAAGHIPAFVGAVGAAQRLTALPAWRDARVVKANPDRAQLPVRSQALRDGKLLYMAVPRLATPRPFYLIDPHTITQPVEEAVSSTGAAKIAPTIAIEDMHPLDLVICGSVAVNPHGARIGKGAGYSDIEVALLADAGLITSHTTIASTVHPLQLVHHPIPTTTHDFRLDLITTPSDVIHCPPHPPPTGIDPDQLTPEQIAAIPVLRELLSSRRADSSTLPYANP